MNKDIFWIAPLVGMGIGLLLPMPYEYYVLLGLVIFVCAIYFFFQLNSQNVFDTTLIWVFGFLALLYNPIIPIYLSKGAGVILSLVTAGVFIVIANKDKV